MSKVYLWAITLVASAAAVGAGFAWLAELDQVNSLSDELMVAKSWNFTFLNRIDLDLEKGCSTGKERVCDGILRGVGGETIRPVRFKCTIKECEFLHCPGDK